VDTSVVGSHALEHGFINAFPHRMAQHSGQSQRGGRSNTRRIHLKYRLEKTAVWKIRRISLFADHSLRV